MNIPLKLADVSLNDKPINEGGVRWVQLKNIWFFNRFMWQKGLLKHLKEKNYDTIILLGTVYYLSTWIAAILWRLRGKKIIFWTHGFLKNEPGIMGFLRSTFYKLAHEYLVYGQRGKNIMIDKGFKEAEITVVYNSLDYDKQRTIREQKADRIFEFENKSLPVIGYIGRVLKQKRLDILIDAAKSFPCNVIIIGDGDALPQLKEMVAQLGLSDRFYFHGPSYKEEEIFNLLSQTDVIVSPGEVGLTAIHAMTYGIPVITHNNFDKQGPEHECIVPGVTGDFFDLDNPVNSLVKTLNRWFSNYDKSEIKKNCYAVIDKYYNPYAQLQIINSVV
ncbi:glycosyltransferase [Mucilaginibacter sp. 21P]|uniref:glycosyltransferase n=1 Tax=Mucilaginibacter sp. 21P TaxID=2778902 RepID=UPI001C575024|nr:glycosyltransferase [Mucilaginibacter sp. 21P]QXV67022.1 glycosyltransferase [Mucilaginibacter sp. 21P]